MVARLCRFKSCCPHQNKQKRTEIVRFVFSYLGLQQDLWQCRALSAHFVCPCTQLTRRSAIILPCLRYYARSARYKSCCPHQKRQSERVVFFHAAADLKQNYVLSANGTAFVCHCTLCSWRFTSANKFARSAITLASLSTSPVVRTKNNVSWIERFDLWCFSFAKNNGRILSCPIIFSIRFI